jgi:3-hydroxyisobutyrate dehydrogenase-like beta-hydroxyacid dehydrogenase
MKVGFVGLGSLGGGMARRLAQTGFELTACDINPATLAAFDEAGAIRQADPIAAARAVDVLCACVRMDADLEALVADGALFAALGEGGLFIIHSTVAPDLARKVAALAKRYGVAVLDAGVSGGAPAALRGELSIYVGGEPAAFERGRKVLEAYGKSVLHLGPVGRGMEGKLLNNLVSIANYGMSAAILDLGERLEFDREQLRQALMAGSAESFALRAVPGLLRPEGAEAMRQLLGKDLDHARELAPETDPAMAALVRAAEAMLDRLGRARPDALTPGDLADRYFACMRSRDLEGLAALFAEDAVAVLPDGREVAGRAAIRGMYQHIFGAGAPTPTPLASIPGPHGVAAEIEAQLPDGSKRRTANFFHLGPDGRIVRLSIYKRGDW